jgi:hypothetical protein
MLFAFLAALQLTSALLFPVLLVDRDVQNVNFVVDLMVNVLLLLLARIPQRAHLGFDGLELPQF